MISVGVGYVGEADWGVFGGAVVVFFAAAAGSTRSEGRRGEEELEGAFVGHCEGGVGAGGDGPTVCGFELVDVC